MRSRSPRVAVLLAVCGRLTSSALVPAAVGAVSAQASTSVPGSASRAIPLVHLVDETHGAAERLCATLKRDTVAIVELPPRDAQSILSMWEHMSGFFALSAEVQASFGPPIEPPFSDLHNGDQRLHGFKRLVHDVTCVDTRLRRQASSGNSVGQLEMLPLDIGDHDSKFVAAMMDAQDVLFSVGLAALNCVRASLPDGSEGSEHAVETMAETGADLAEGVTSATVHRLLLYNAPSAERESRAPEEPDEFGLFSSEPRVTSEGSQVLFEGHTDATWFTVIPCAIVAGVEVLTPDGWCSSLETSGRPGIDVAVLSGDFLESLSKKAGGSVYPAAHHRVVRPPGTTEARLSAPLLMRAAPRYRKAIGCEGDTFDCV